MLFRHHPRSLLLVRLVSHPWHLTMLANILERRMHTPARNASAGEDNRRGRRSGQDLSMTELSPVCLSSTFTRARPPSTFFISCFLFFLRVDASFVPPTTLRVSLSFIWYLPAPFRSSSSLTVYASCTKLSPLLARALAMLHEISTLRSDINCSLTHVAHTSPSRSLIHPRSAVDHGSR